MNVIGWVSWSGERVTIFEGGEVGPKRCVTTGNAWWLSTLRQTIFPLIALRKNYLSANVFNPAYRSSKKWPANFKTMWLVRCLTSFVDTTVICTSFYAWSRSRILNKRFYGLVSEGEGTLGRVCKAMTPPPHPPQREIKRLLSEANFFLQYNLLFLHQTKWNSIKEI